jgi:cardiolipin synthase
MHVRAVVVDGGVGYTGGFGIDDRWLGDGRHPDQWRDTSVRVEGSAVNRLQAAFASNWAEATGELLLGDAVFRFEDAPGPHTAGLLYSAPSFGSTAAERFFFTSLAAARERCYLTTAYFLPNRYFRRLLCEAAGRGVDVRVLTPGANTDRPSTWYAARGHYPELLEGGVRLYEYRPTMLHAKTMVVDGIWGMVGTLNFDNRSMVLNDEVALAFWDGTLGEALDGAFAEDLRRADELTLAGVRARSRGLARAGEWLAGRVERVL